MLYAILTILGRFLDFFSCYFNFKRKKENQKQNILFPKYFSQIGQNSPQNKITA
jgi:hypothetical protein